jgi:PAS domain-containing protein
MCPLPGVGGVQAAMGRSRRIFAWHWRTLILLDPRKWSTWRPLCVEGGNEAQGKNPRDMLPGRPCSGKGLLTCMQGAALATALITNAPDAIILTDCVGGIRLWSLGAEAPFGHSAAEAVGHTLNLSVSELSRTVHWAGFARAVQPGRFTKDARLQTSSTLTKHSSGADDPMRWLCGRSWFW